MVQNMKNYLYKCDEHSAIWAGQRYFLVLLGVTHVDGSHLSMWLNKDRKVQDGGHNISGDELGYLLQEAFPAR